VCGEGREQERGEKEAEARHAGIVAGEMDSVLEM
jgi:hypothetical protein